MFRLGKIASRIAHVFRHPERRQNRRGDRRRRTGTRNRDGFYRTAAVFAVRGAIEVNSDRKINPYEGSFQVFNTFLILNSSISRAERFRAIVSRRLNELPLVLVLFPAYFRAHFSLTCFLYLTRICTAKWSTRVVGYRSAINVTIVSLWNGELILCCKNSVTHILIIHTIFEDLYTELFESCDVTVIGAVFYLRL